MCGSRRHAVILVRPKSRVVSSTQQPFSISYHGPDVSMDSGGAEASSEVGRELCRLASVHENSRCTYLDSCLDVHLTLITFG